jgi:aspartyl-tRNA(Asn)/glutamyl-tRNA(Gln) amidotransferase subunit C
MSEKIVKRVAELARINLNKKELERFSKDLESILDAFKNLKKVNTDDVKPTYHPVEVKNVVREDIVESSLSQKQILKGVKNKERGYFKGPRVV